MLRIAENAGREFFTRYEVRLIGEAVIEDGSSKLWVRIRTSAIVLLGLAGSYGTARSGIEYIWKDGKVAAEWMADQLERSLPDHPEDRRRRAPAAARLLRLFERVEAGEISAADATKRAEEILREYREDADTITAVVAQLRHEFASIQANKPIRPNQTARTSLGRPPTPIRTGNRLSVFRDPRTGQIRFV